MELPALRSKHRILTPHINLYPEDPFDASILGKGLKWALSIGRHIVIFTELVVIGSFLSRFVLDRQLSDLNKEIVQKQAVVESYGTLEDDFRALQLQTRDIASIIDDQGQYVVLEVLARLTPPEIRFTQVSYGNNALSLQGISLSNDALNIFVEGMRRDPAFSTVSISNIRSGDDRDPSIQFTVTAQSTKGVSRRSSESAEEGTDAPAPTAEEEAL
jgi:Tfp pilus assembly protein PilN